MNRADALALVEPHLTTHRYVHTIGVADTALELADHTSVDKARLELAAIFHDYAKFRDKPEMRAIIEMEDFDPDFLSYGDELLHAPAGAYLVKKEIGIEDPEILSAITWHTTGKPDMTTMEKILFLADYIEPNRTFPGVIEVRELSVSSLDQAIIKALANTIEFLMKKRQPVYPGTLATYNQLVFKFRKGNVNEK